MSSEVMAAKELRDRTTEELITFLQEKSEELFKLRFQHYTGQLENTARLKQVKRELARARTIITERDRGLSAEPEASNDRAPTDADTSTETGADEEDES